MSNTAVQREAEEWIRVEDLPSRYGQRFQKVCLQLRSGGTFEFDAVSADRQTVCVISTSQLATSGNPHGTGKVAKVYKDLFFLLLVDTPRRLAIFTEPCLAGFFQREKQRGRVPSEIDVVCIGIPDEMAGRLRISRETASTEVRRYD